MKKKFLIITFATLFFISSLFLFLKQNHIQKTVPGNLSDFTVDDIPKIEDGVIQDPPGTVRLPSGGAGTIIEDQNTDEGGVLPPKEQGPDVPSFLEENPPTSGATGADPSPSSRNDMAGQNNPQLDGYTGAAPAGYPTTQTQNTQINAPTDVPFFESILPSSKFAGQPLNNILNQLFWVGLVIAVILAIVMIIRGGVEYMTIDAISSKESGKNRIKAALGGLLLAFSAILILNTINPGITNLRIGFAPLKQVGQVQIQGAYGGLNSTGTRLDPTTGQPVLVTPGSEGSAQFTEVVNEDKLNAMAKGVITINGKGYPFISGGSGKGYLPPGTYEVTMNTNESSDGTRTASGFVKDGVGFAFNLNDANDSRTGFSRSDLRIHPDGNNPGTNGCIGLQGNGAELSQFKTDLTGLIKANGGKYKITVGK